MPRYGPVTDAEEELQQILKSLMHSRQLEEQSRESRSGGDVPASNGSPLLAALINGMRSTARAGDLEWDELPLPPPPPGFRTKTTVAPVNLDDGHEDPYQRLLRILPELEGVVPSVQYSPPEGYELDREGGMRDKHGGEVYGTFNRRDKSINVSPKIAGSDISLYTLAHEYGHRFGLPEPTSSYDGAGADKMRDVEVAALKAGKRRSSDIERYVDTVKRMKERR